MGFGAILGGASAAQGILGGVANARQLKRDAENAKVSAKFTRAFAAEEAEFIRQQGQSQLEAFLQRGDELLIDANRIQDNTAIRADEVRREGRTMVSTAIARAAAGGIDSSSGSPLEAQAEVVFQAEKLASQTELVGQFEVDALLLERDQLIEGGQNALFIAQTQARSTILTGEARAQGFLAASPSQAAIIGSVVDPLRGLAEKGPALVESFRSSNRARTQTFGSLGNPTETQQQAGLEF